MPPFSQRRSFWRGIAYFDRSKVIFPIALRNAIGVFVPLAIGAAAGQPGGGLIAAIGALNVAYSDGADPYGLRARRMCAATFFCALALFAGCASGQSHPVTLLLTAAAAWAAGMMVAVGTTATDIGNIALVTLIVFSAHGLPLGEAAQCGALALGGGLLQTALALALWPVHPYGPERRALSTLYAAAARAAANPGHATEAPPASAESTQTQNALADLRRNPSVEADRYLALLSQAERIRLALMTLGRLRFRMERDFEAAAPAAAIGQALAIAARLLDSVAHSLGAAQPNAPPQERPDEVRRIAESLRRPAPASAELAAVLRDARWQLEALAGQLRAALELAAYDTPEGGRVLVHREAGQPWKLRAEGVLAAMQANLSLDSTAFRHAVRLAVCIAASELAAFWLGWQRSYWIPMTAAIVLRPDFTTTFTRGILRLAGTLIGLAVATVLFHLAAPPLAAQVAYIFLWVLLLRWLGPANYGVFVTALSALIVLLLAVTGSPPTQVIAERARGTLLGGAIALLGYGAWPTRERGLVPAALAGMFDAYRDYFRAVAQSYIQRADALGAEIDGARQAARLARSNAEASAARLRAEPGPAPGQLRILDAILANSHRFVRAAMALESGLARSRPAPARDAFRRFYQDVERTLYFLAAGLRGSSVTPADFPDLREDHAALIASGDARVERYALVNVETDRITNSLNTLTGEVMEWIMLNF